MRWIVVGIGLSLLSGCGGATKGSGSAGNAAANGSAPQAEAQVNAPPALDETQRRIVAMSEAERNAVLIRAIRAAHQDCQHVDSSEAVDTGAGQPSYIATCDRTKHYAVAIGPNGAGAVTAPEQPRR